ncbi:MAG: histidine phosphatase family protein [Verrucomicrobiaceae bacterium]|nr:histidine phosphatase family protein [Verrucomicrobiaceae bacterium]
MKSGHRICLLRHFPVDRGLPTGWLTAEDLQRWKLEYDESPVTVSPVSFTTDEWQTCVASDLSRAHQTALNVFGSEVEVTPLLREAEFMTFRTGKLRMPVRVWTWLLRLCWLTGHRSQRACRDDLMQRVKAAADAISERPGNVLVVAHGGLMIYLSRELLARGYSGPKLRMPKHVTPYCYERL